MVLLTITQRYCEFLSNTIHTRILLFPSEKHTIWSSDHAGLHVLTVATSLGSRPQDYLLYAIPMLDFEPEFNVGL